MLISRTPMRVSLFGGGTDYPEYFEEKPGAVIGFAIDKYIYISAIRLHSFVDYRYRVAYSKVEVVEELDAIEHPVVKGVLQTHGWPHPMDFAIQQDLPAASGLGSSSSFTVGFLNIVLRLKGDNPSKLELARHAIHIERDVLKERVGVQDQLHAAFGGFRRYDFLRHHVTVDAMPFDAGNGADLTDWLMLVHTGRKRRATMVIEEQLKRTAARKIDAELRQMLSLVDEAQKIIAGTPSRQVAEKLAPLLHESWQLKRSLSPHVSDGEIDDLYAQCRQHGALAGKLCGAGGGGFLLVIVPPERRAAFLEALGPRRCVQFQIDFRGSSVLEIGEFQPQADATPSPEPGWEIILRERERH